jgi:predicted O-methyltransferase YrrM
MKAPLRKTRPVDANVNPPPRLAVEGQLCHYAQGSLGETAASGGDQVSVYANPAIDKMVAIDEAHASLLVSLVASRKPSSVLELGFGAGQSCRSILKGLAYNDRPFHFDLVDNWCDFDGRPPEEVSRPDYEKVNFTTADERDFVFACERKYELIFSDADHHHTQDWFEKVYDDLLEREGILIYHDVTNAQLFPNLLRIYADAVRRDLHHMLFNYNSRPDERCDRGLLVIFKH